MSTIEPAFPHDEKADDGTHWHTHSGMTLRDWFAGQALCSMGQWEPCPPEGYPVGPIDQAARQRRRAEWAYQQADAMLAERARNQP